MVTSLGKIPKLQLESAVRKGWIAHKKTGNNYFGLGIKGLVSTEAQQREVVISPRRSRIMSPRSTTHDRSKSLLNYGVRGEPSNYCLQLQALEFFTFFYKIPALQSLLYSILNSVENCLSSLLRVFFRYSIQWPISSTNPRCPNLKLKGSQLHRTKAAQFQILRL